MTYPLFKFRALEKLELYSKRRDSPSPLSIFQELVSHTAAVMIVSPGDKQHYQGKQCSLSPKAGMAQFMTLKQKCQLEAWSCG